MRLSEDGEPRSIEIRCKGDKCHKINSVVEPEIVGYGDITVGIVGEAPYKDEVDYRDADGDIHPRPFVGNSGVLLRQYFDYDKYTYYIVNSINCLTYEYETTVKPSEMTVRERTQRLMACKPFVDQVLNLLDDGSVIVTLGVFARLSLFGDKVSVSVFPREYGLGDKRFFVFVNHHPSYLLHKPSMVTEFEEILEASGVFKFEGQGS